MIPEGVPCPPWTALDIQPDNLPPEWLKTQASRTGFPQGVAARLLMTTWTSDQKLDKDNLCRGRGSSSAQSGEALRGRVFPSIPIPDSREVYSVSR